jgi:hypothetical protein
MGGVANTADRWKETGQHESRQSVENCWSDYGNFNVVGRNDKNLSCLEIPLGMSGRYT